MNLLKNPNFINEYRAWSNQISRIENLDIKKEMSSMLVKLLDEVKKIDTFHNELNIRPNIDPSISESRQTIFNLRNKILEKLKEYNESIL